MRWMCLCVTVWQASLQYTHVPHTHLEANSPWQIAWVQSSVISCIVVWRLVIQHPESPGDEVTAPHERCNTSRQISSWAAGEVIVHSPVMQEWLVLFFMLVSGHHVMPNPCICYHKGVVFNVPEEAAPTVWPASLTSCSASRHAGFSTSCAVWSQSFLSWVPGCSQFQRLARLHRYLEPPQCAAAGLFHRTPLHLFNSHCGQLLRVLCAFHSCFSLSCVSWSGKAILEKANDF